MKILKLTIHNIASIADATIDFTASPLKDAGLFLISGKTGAGKSTILDCICLALYDKTPRLNSTLIKDDIKDFNSDGALGADDTRQMLSKYAAEGYTTLEFIGNNGITYRATWSVNRARQKVTGKLQNKKQILERLDKNISFTKKGEIAEEIAIAVNLDFNQFCRTVMLAQGEFTRFLNSSDNDKSAILSKITGTEIYSVLGARIFEKYKEQVRVLEKYGDAIAGMEILTDEQLSEKHLVLQDLTAEITQLSASLERQSNLLNSLRSIEKVENDIASLNKNNYQSILSYRAYTREIEKLQENLSALDKEIAQTESDRKKFDDTVEIINRYGAIISIIDRIVETRSRIHSNSESISDKEQEKNIKLVAERDKILKQIQEEKKIIEAKELETNELNKELEEINMPRLREDKEALMKERINIENLKISISAYTNELKNLDENKSALKTAEINSKDIVAKLEELREPELKAKIRLETVQEIYDKLFTSSEDIMSKIRSSLNIGDICPVCRNKIIKALPSDESIAVLTSERKKDLDNARKNLDKIIRSKNKLNSELSAEQRLIAKLKDKIENNKSLSKAENNLRNNCELSGIECDKSIDILALLQLYNDRVLDISSRDKALSSLIAEAERLEINIKDKNNEIKALRLKSEKSSTSYNNLVLKITACDKHIEVYKDQIKQFEQEIQGLDSKLNNELRDSIYFSLISQPDNFNSLRSILKSDADEMKALNDLLNKKTALREKLNINLTNHLSTLNSITEILPELTEDMTSYEEQPREITIRKDQLATFGTKLIGDIRGNRELLNSLSAELKSELEALNDYRKNNPDEEVSVDLCSVRCLELKSVINLKHRETGALQSEIEREKSNREKRKKLHDEYNKQEQLLEKWHKLYELFGDAEGKKFRKIAQSYILAELIYSANHYLSGFTDRYRLSIEPGTFVIIVEDAWDGFARRPASTISGGESFMVSLSLALALSDLSTDFSVDTLFIDEGFGSLSEEYLQSAISTLRTLHSRSGRRVGIISHVEELRERIPVQINVSSSPNQPSSSIVLK